MTALQDLAGYRIGDVVRLPTMDVPLEVVALDPPALLVVRAPSGRELRAGWRAVARDDRIHPNR